MSAEAEYHPTIMELPSSERPRERLLVYGANALSNAELLAIILRVGAPDQNVILVAQALLSKFSGLTGIAKAIHTEDLLSILMEVSGAVDTEKASTPVSITYLTCLTNSDFTKWL